MSGQQESTMTQTQRTGPSAEALPFIQSGLGTLQANVNQPSVFYPEIQKQINALQGIGDVGFGDRTPATDRAAQAAIDRAVGTIIPQVASTFGRAGQGQSGLARDAATRSIADVIGQQFASSYEQNEARRLQAALANRQAQMQAAATIGSLAGLGESLSPAALANERALALIRASQALGGEAQDIVPIYRNQTAGALGGAIGGAQMGSTFGPWGAAAGAGLGLLGGLF